MRHIWFASGCHSSCGGFSLLLTRTLQGRWVGLVGLCQGALMISLAALDIAGTTVDDQHLVYAALRDCLTNDGVDVTPEALGANMGRRKDHAIQQLLHAARQPHDLAVVQRYYAAFTALLHEYYAATPPVAFPMVTDTIAQLRAAGIKVALTTGFSRDVAAVVLEHVGWQVGPDGMVDALVCADEVPAGRPAPHLIHRAMERTGVLDVRTVLAAGDTVADLQAGTNSGASLVVGVLTGPTPEEKLLEAPHTHIVKSVADLPEVLGNQL